MNCMLNVSPRDQQELRIRLVTIIYKWVDLLLTPRRFRRFATTPGPDGAEKAEDSTSDEDELSAAKIFFEEPVEGVPNKPTPEVIGVIICDK